MDNSNTTTEISNSNIFSNTKNIIIIILCILLTVSVLGSVYISIIFKNIINSISQLLAFFGYTTGTLINASADIVGTSLKTGVDIAEGTAHNIGNILKNESSYISNENKLDNVINSSNAPPPPPPPPHPVEIPPPIPKDEPIPDNTENPIQKPITANKNNWCLVGEYQQKRGCIEINENDKCLSGQMFSSQQLCIQTPGKFQNP